MSLSSMYSSDQPYDKETSSKHSSCTKRFDGAHPPHDPGSYTFGSLFNALLRLATLRNSADRPPRQPPNAPSPRQLFREMLECHVLVPKSNSAQHPVVAVSTLNVALRLFMQTMDYPGAFITLQTFRTLDLKPDIRSYRAVLNNLLARFRLALLAERSWHATPAGHLTFWAAIRDAGYNSKTYGPRSRTRCWNSPSEGPNTCSWTRGSTGEEEPPMDAEWDVEPLERLVAKASCQLSRRRL
ncbi:hypothetical protein BGW80DRAFT_797351 [Lactifluus volemus]|nr:hypothetical protein BGW80DRAFT_797351 [Lactifluus volemus]